MGGNKEERLNLASLLLFFCVCSGVELMDVYFAGVFNLFFYILTANLFWIGLEEEFTRWNGFSSGLKYEYI